MVIVLMAVNNIIHVSFGHNNHYCNTSIRETLYHLFFSLSISLSLNLSVTLTLFVLKLSLWNSKLFEIIALSSIIHIENRISFAKLF